MTLEQIVTAEGYRFESHFVVTEDGYVLNLHRIFKDGDSKAHRLMKDSKLNTGKRPVVFLQHGLMSSSEVFLLNGENSLGQQMAKSGYDVWLGNTRGNMYSRQHQQLDPDLQSDQKEFFNYSFYEVAKYDLPAMVDYALIATGHTNLTYIGHSIGATIMLTALAESFGSKLEKKLNLFIELLNPDVRKNINTFFFSSTCFSIILNNPNSSSW